jgi:hypothetical protein
VDDYVWHGAFDLRSLDETVEKAGHTLSMSVRGYDAAGLACQVMTRYQRLLDRRNRFSTGPVFDAVLRAHEGMFDVENPLSKTELDHALDAWQWTLRLDPDAGLAVQLATLFHDLERLERDPRERMEHRAPDYQSARDGHKSAERMLQLLVGAGVSEHDAERVRDIVFCSERPSEDREVLLVNDADALSFFSLGSSGYVDYFGVAQTRRKVAYTLARLGRQAREQLDRIRLRRDVERLLQEVAA